LEEIRIAVAHRGAGLVPVFAAVEGGYFREQDLEPRLDFVAGRHAGALEALIAGQADFINTVAPALIRANAEHPGDAVIIASAIGRSAQQIAARPPFTSREELRGRRWGVTARNDADECVILMAFERWGWDVAKDAEIVVVGTGTPRLDLLLDAGKVDAAIMHAPEPFQALKRGWRIVEDLCRLDAPFQNSCAATTRRLLRERPDIALRFLRGYCRGVYRFRTDAAFGLDVLRKYTEEPDQDVLAGTWLLFARLMGGMMFPSLEGVRAAVDLLRRLGAIGGHVTAEQQLSLEPVAALEREGYFATFMGRGGAERSPR
jgi:ABC-type nitrate/sulfonate/bicarbonate transport system substrate-binding protein